MKIIAIAAFAVVLNGSAFAADMAVKAPPASKITAFSWTGFYVGGDIGGGWVKSSGQGLDAVMTPGSGPAYSFTNSGVLGGGFVGAQYQWQNIVLGVEADIQGTDIKGNSPPTLTALGGGPYTVSTKVSSYDSVRARLGFAYDKWLFFGTGGWASARWKASYAFTGTPPFFTDSASKDGWAAGVGVNYAVTNNVFLALEYRHTALRTASAGPDFAVNSFSTDKITIDDVRGGIGFKFP